MSPRFPMTPGPRRAPSARLLAALAALPLFLSACMYSLTGGGLPANIRTVYIELWENTTPYEYLRADVQRELQGRLPRDLGVRLAAQQNADAIVRGKLTSYEEVTVNLDPNTSPGGRIQPQQRRVQITFDAEIYDVKEDKVLWRGQSISAIGNYNPENERVDVARERAVEELLQKVVQGAQSQW